MKHVFNHDCKENGQKHTPLKAPTYEEHMKLIAAELGLDPQYACGLSTAADMENVSIQSETYENLAVTAVVTGGIDVNGGRVGDPSQWHEANGISIPVTGTINILLFIDAKLPEGTLTRALVTCTEAKTAALQELLAPSLYSSGIATGYGRTIRLSSRTPNPPLSTYAGKHAKLGELIGRTVMRPSRKPCICRQASAPTSSPTFSAVSAASASPGKHPRRGTFRRCQKARRPVQTNRLVVMTSLYVHLLTSFNGA